jgi:leucyl-tRNA synthetase
MRRYNPKQVEPKWQKIWEDRGIYKAVQDSKKPKKYVLEYFPYPSGATMHVGHVRNYTIGDVLARFNRMQQKTVLHPMGWDAFGLPAENYAIKTGINPRQAIDKNTAKFKQQLMQMGFSYDWSREIDSTDPRYYKWTQWFFLLLYERGLAYQQESLQWWCPVDKTVLANEQVEAGKCWRCGSDVEKKSLNQWFFKITEYADRLLDDLDNLDWSDAIKTMQRNWIGRSFGAEVLFQIENSDEAVTVYTTRPDTLYGATFLVIAPEHPLVDKLTIDEQKASVHAYRKQAETRSDIERQETKRKKTGVFSGSYAINPINQQKIPIWIADYVLVNYGTGAIMGVPAHDSRDYDFAVAFHLPIINVIDPVAIRDDVKTVTDFISQKKIVAIVVNNNKEVLTINWGPERGGRLLIGGTIENSEDPSQAALREITEETGYNDLEVEKVSDETFHYKYFAFTKQQAHEAEVKFVTVSLKSDAQQPPKLDASEANNFSVEWVPFDHAARDIGDPLHHYGVEKFILGECYEGEGILINSAQYDGTSTSEARDLIIADLAKNGKARETVNYKIRDWLISRQRYWGAPIPIIHCPKDGIVPVPKQDLPVVLPILSDFLPSGDGKSPLSKSDDFVNVTCPICGGPARRETDTMDGFACSSWYFLRFADPLNDELPFAKDKVAYWLPVDNYIGGAEHAVMHLLYARFWTKVMFDAGLVSFDEPFSTLQNQGMILAPDGQKMSKSKGNTIEPDTLISQGYGADAIRLMELFLGPWNQKVAWNIEGLGGTFRFLQRVWVLTQEYIDYRDQNKARPQVNSTISQDIIKVTHRAIRQVSIDLEQFGFNTAIAAQMELVNELYKLKVVDNFADLDSWHFAISQLLLLLAPFAPHVAEELWEQLGGDFSIHLTSWPGWDDSLLVENTITIAVQVNGKFRSEIEVPAGISQDEIVELAKQNSKVSPYIPGDATIKKVIFVPKKLVNLLV